MAHRHEHLCSTSQLWLPHPALCVVPPECFQGLCIWSGAVGSKSGKLRNIADHDSHGMTSLPLLCPPLAASDPICLHSAPTPKHTHATCTTTLHPLSD